MKHIIFINFKYAYNSKHSKDFKDIKLDHRFNYCDQICSTNFLKHRGYKFPKYYKIHRYINCVPMEKHGKLFILISRWGLQRIAEPYSDEKYNEPIGIFVNGTLCQNSSEYFDELVRITS